MFKPSRLAVAVAAATLTPLLLAGSVNATPIGAPTNKFWWPEQLDLSSLRVHDVRSNPYGADFDYVAEFSKVDYQALKNDIETTLTNSQDWWPADWGHYGGLMIRMAWHSAGTYRVHDGRGGADGGQLRFDPLNSWPDNGNLDKARRLLWPVKQKYGRSVSWADLMILAGNVSLESMGFQTLGFAGGRADDWEADEVYWGKETSMLSNEERYEGGELERPLAAVQMGLIYVNPEGPNANMDPLAAAQDMRESFGRMAMNDEEIVALVAGGHTLGKGHGAHKPADCVGPEPGAAPIEEQGFGWKNSCGKGHSEDTVTSGLEGAWTQTPTAWSILYLDNLFRMDWEQHTSPAGAHQWRPVDKRMHEIVPDAHIASRRNPPVMFTTDIALKEDPGFRAVAERFWKNPEEFDAAFARAWFKLTHRDLGPRARYVGPEVPEETYIWQDPVPEGNTLSDRDVAKLKKAVLKSGLTVPQLVRTAWASASTYRESDMRGGANGARIALAPQKDWAVNNPQELAQVLSKLGAIQADHGKVSLADLIVIGGAAGIEQAAREAGHKIDVLVTTGRGDATQEMTDVVSFAVLEPKADAFRNYYTGEAYMPPTEMLIDKADLLGLTIPEMTALLGGMRVLGANADGATAGVLTDNPGTLNNAFFVNLLTMDNEWSKSGEATYIGRNRATGKAVYTATSVDLIFGSNSELRAVAETYASNDGEALFLSDFVAAWNKVMEADLY
ncbi:catalase-peroxidase 2 [Halioglobus japonicus]|uniref:Catalase-peroxidase n=1 Tax=Halioglobus japonicus TaxID=930805 RepID=A0AAP8MEA1_9GAMM|nr:catalase/peroxidase HPI [Halioglobus japonicus]PLW86211.1 catalase/peroxidase HPI [Halioglobus japonicus]GHD13909.1 catalase-peroxidase 2 [Halioglobus japonicus]